MNRYASQQFGMPGIVVAVVCILFSSLRGYADNINYDNYVELPFHYEMLETKSDPMEISISQGVEHLNLQSLTLNDSYVIRYGLRYASATVSEIGEFAFFDTAIRDIKLSSSVRTIGESAFRSSCLEEIILNEGLLYIGDHAFSRTKIRKIEIPESVKFIDTGAFFYCEDLKTVILPSTLSSLYGYTFAYCPGIEEIYCHAVLPPYAETVDFRCHNEVGPDPDCGSPDNINVKECILYVPAQSVELYKKAPGWSIFENILPISD